VPREIVSYRPANGSDVPALVRVINRAYRVESFFLEGDRTDEQEVAAMLRTPRGAFVVADLETQPVAGAVYVEVRGERGYFGMLSVDPAHQGKGLARNLILSAEHHCRDAGCEFLDITVVDLRAELPAFYARFGFAPFDVAPFPMPERLTRPARLVRMTKPLSPLFSPLPD
jgi:GNAT superfamily N-acetyltransferase